ncbi:hypothetical protein [Listeria valentina]|uniref:hypothetical protein n=1 Tax=Listeria valentina TaxID=2705293 RepID=UPI0014305662|nr:hypothetical protein [Listeria valentina]
MRLVGIFIGILFSFVILFQYVPIWFPQAAESVQMMKDGLQMGFDWCVTHWGRTTFGLILMGGLIWIAYGSSSR